MKNFINKLKSISNKVYDELGAGFDERYVQTALGIEFTNNNIKFLREVSIEVFYKNHPLGLFELDFLIYPTIDLNEPVIVETKVTSKLTDDSKQQLKNYLRSAPLNNNEDLQKVKKGILINFKKSEIFKEGINTIPEDKTSLEVWGFKNNKFKLIE